MSADNGSPVAVAAKSFNEKFSQLASPDKDKDDRPLSARRDPNKWENLVSPRTPRSEHSVEDVVERLVELDEREITLERDVQQLIQNQERLVQMVDAMRHLVIAAASPTSVSQSPLSMDDLKKENENLKKKVDELRTELEKQASPQKKDAPPATAAAAAPAAPAAPAGFVDPPPAPAPKAAPPPPPPPAPKPAEPAAEQHTPVKHADDQMKQLATELETVTKNKPPPPPPPKKASGDQKALLSELKHTVDKQETEKEHEKHHKQLPAVHDELLKKVEEEKIIHQEKQDNVRKVNFEIQEAVKERKPPPPPPPKATPEQHDLLKELKQHNRENEQKKAVESHKGATVKIAEELEKKLEEKKAEGVEKRKRAQSMKDVMKEMEWKVKNSQSHYSDMYSKPKTDDEKRRMHHELGIAVAKKREKQDIKEHKDKMGGIAAELHKQTEKLQKEKESKEQLKKDQIPKLNEELLQKRSSEAAAPPSKLLEETEKHRAEKDKLQMAQSIVEEKSEEREAQFHQLLLRKSELEKRVEELEVELRAAKEELRHSNVKNASLKKKLDTANELQSQHIKRIEELTSEVEKLSKK